MRSRRWTLALLALCTLSAVAQSARPTRQRAFPRTVAAGNYSGVTWLGGERYAVVNDKSPTAGFYLMTLRVDSVSGRIAHASVDTFLTSGQQNRDEEGICYFPPARTLFVSGEADGQIIEYRQDGTLTGRRLDVPEVFRTAHANGGFEALTYDTVAHRFWTTSEQTLRADGQQPTLKNKIPNRLRLQAFDDQLRPAGQYWYETDRSVVRGTRGRSTLGVSALAALGDGRLVVLEREVYVARRKIGSFVQVKLYAVRPADSAVGTRLEKQLLTAFRTRLNLTARSFANYEGMCLGPRLKDGRRVLVLVADSQNQYRGYLRDWLRTVVLDR